MLQSCPFKQTYHSCHNIVHTSKIYIETDRQRKTDRERDRERGTERDTERDRETQRDRERQRETERQREETTRAFICIAVLHSLISPCRNFDPNLESSSQYFHNVTGCMYFT